MSDINKTGGAPRGMDPEPDRGQPREAPKGMDPEPSHAVQGGATGPEELEDTAPEREERVPSMNSYG